MNTTPAPAPSITDELHAAPTVSIATAAHALGISRAYAYRLVAAGDFPCRVLRLGHKTRVPAAELRRVLGIEQ